jgi:hypothetical protein
VGEAALEGVHGGVDHGGDEEREELGAELAARHRKPQRAAGFGASPVATAMGRVPKSAAMKETWNAWARPWKPVVMAAGRVSLAIFCTAASASPRGPRQGPG